MHTKPSMVQCALGWIPSGTLVIVWRGTANFRNVITDIKFFSRKVISLFKLPILTDTDSNISCHMLLLEEALSRDQLVGFTSPENLQGDVNAQLLNLHRSGSVAVGLLHALCVVAIGASRVSLHACRSTPCLMHSQGQKPTVGSWRWATPSACQVHWRCSERAQPLSDEAMPPPDFERPHARAP